MLALSIRQPWASLIAMGAKTVEVRSWSTPHRGPLLIHASGRDCECDGVTAPAGYAIAVVDVLDVRPMTAADLEAACMEELPEGAFAWVLGNARQIEPFALKGRLNLFETDCDPAPLEGAGEEWTHIDAIMRLRGVA